MGYRTSDTSKITQYIELQKYRQGWIMIVLDNSWLRIQVLVIISTNASVTM